MALTAAMRLRRPNQAVGGPLNQIWFGDGSDSHWLDLAGGD